MAKNVSSNAYEGGLTVDPTIPPGVPAVLGAIFLRVDTSEIWQKFGAADTDWKITSPLPVGPTYGLGPTLPGILQPAFTPQVITIYARPSGNDTTGVGSFANPYLTTQRAVRDVPHVIPPGTRVIVDNTGVVETLPANFEFPVIKNCHAFELNFFDPDYFIDTGFSIRATPKALATGGQDFLLDAGFGGDVISVVADPATKLVTITVANPRTSWGANGMKGKFLQYRGTFGPITFSALISSATIRASTLTTLSLAAGIDGIGPDYVWIGVSNIVDAGATLQGTSPTTAQAMNFADMSTFGLFGQKLVNNTADGPAGLKYAINLQGCSGNAFFMFADINGLSGGVESNPVLLNCYFHNKSFLLSGPGALTVNTFFESIPSFPQMGDFPTNWAIQACAFKACPAIGGRLDPNAYATSGRMGLQIINSLIEGAVADADGFTPADGVRVTGGFAGLLFVQINTSGRNGVYVAEGAGDVRMQVVTGGGNVAAGIVANDGSIVHVDAFTSVAGSLGNDMIVGVLPARTWADFRANAPLQNQFDGGTGIGSNGARIYQP